MCASGLSAVPSMGWKGYFSSPQKTLASKLPVWGGGMQQREKERKTEESGSGDTWLLIAMVEGNPCQEEMGSVETPRKDGVPKYFLYQIADRTTAKVQVSHRLTQSRGRTLWDLSPKPCALLVFLLHNRTSSVLRLGTFRGDIFFLTEELSISCWISWKEMWKVRFWSTYPWIIIICRIRAVAAFSFTQILETGVKIENMYQLVQNGISRMLQPKS